MLKPRVSPHRNWEMNYLVSTKIFQTLFFPPNCTALIQPMDQHVIKNVKLLCRKSLLLNVISEENEDITTILKKFDLLAAVFSLKGA